MARTKPQQQAKERKMKRLLVAIALAITEMATLAARAKSYPPQNLSRVREIAALLREEPGFAEMRITNRDAWERIANDKTADSVIRSAESIIAKPMEQLDDSVYTNQDKEVWGPISGRRGRSIMPLAFAECMENRGRFLPNLIERLDAIAAQTTWMNPYHDRPHFGNFYGKYSTIDLNVSEMALNVAIVLDLLKGKIPEATVSNLVEKTWKQCYRTYLSSAADYNAHHPENGWFFGDNNWNPACHYQSVVSALFMIPDAETRAKFVEAAERAMPYYLGGFSNDGYCQEGAAYFDYGFGQYARLGLFVRKATAGKVDFFADAKARRCCLCAYEFQLAVGAVPMFGDGRVFGPPASVMSLCELVWPELVSSMTYSITLTNTGLDNCLLKAFSDSDCQSAQNVPEYRLPIRTFLEDAQIYIGRTLSPGASTLSACIKGGNNGVPHNHNDAGQFVLALGRTQMVLDTGGKEYDFDTFTSKRYNHPMLNSYGHAVPYPDGTLQAAGKEYRAKILRKEFLDSRDTLVLDLKPTYTNDNIHVLERTLVYDRGISSAMISDRAVFSKPSTYECPIITYGKVEKRGENAFAIIRKSDQVVKRLDFTVDTNGAKWHVKEERLPNPRRVEPTRWAVAIDEPSVEHAVTLTFTPGENPPEIIRHGNVFNP